MKKVLKNLLCSGRGSILMEFVIVMPLYITALGGIFWVGYKSLDATNLRVAASWSVWSANRYASPSVSDLEDLFPRADSVSNNLKRSLYARKSYLEFVGSNASIQYEKPEFIKNWQESANSMYGEDENAPRDDETELTSSNHDNTYTNYLTMRTKGSIQNIRLLYASRLAKKRYWDFDSNKDENIKYPDEWDPDLIRNAKNTDDNFTDPDAKNDVRDDFYDRYSRYVEWSERK